jgi:hypothetical protein
MRREKRRNFSSVISKTAGLLDTVARSQYTFHFALHIFSTSPFRELCKSYKKMHVGCQVKQTLRLDFTIICPKHKMIVFYSKDA